MKYIWLILCLFGIAGCVQRVSLSTHDNVITQSRGKVVLPVKDDPKLNQIFTQYHVWQETHPTQYPES